MSLTRIKTRFVLALVAATAPGCKPEPAATVSVADLSMPKPTVEEITVPKDLLEAAELEPRRAAQLKAGDGIKAFHGFAFTDRLAQSGIAFRHQIVDDAGRDYKAVHYDHGTGIAVADVDGDGLLDVFFVNQLGPSALYRNLGGARFEDATARAGVATPGRIAVGAAFADIDNDGDADLFVTTVRGGNVLYQNDGHGVFQDVTAQAGVGYVGHSSGALFFDWNRDGLLDLFVNNIGRYTTDQKGPGGYFVGHKDAFASHLKPERAESSVLYQNMGGNKFTDVTAKVGLVDTSWNGDADAFDANDDGYPDLYVLNMQGHDQYFENQKGASFKDRSREVFPATPWGTMGIQVFDYDNDGRLDVYLTDMHTDMATALPPAREKTKLTPAEMFPPNFQATDGKHVLGNALFHNVGKGAFKEVSDAMNAENYWPWGPSAGDSNADGWTYFFIPSGMNFPFRYAVNSLLLNEAGARFADAEYLLGVEPRRDGRSSVRWFELDCAGADKAHRECAGHSGHVIVSGSVGTRSAALFDLDRDGDLDIVTNEFGDAPMVLVSDLGEKRKVQSIEVRLRGTRSNRAGIGATVTVRAGKLSLTRLNDGKSGYLSQSLMPLFFGLGDADHADRIEVLWPSGKRQTVPGPHPAGKPIEVVEK